MLGNGSSEPEGAKLHSGSLCRFTDNYRNPKTTKLKSMVAVLLQSLTYFSQSFARLSLISSLICGYVAIDGRSSTLKLFLHSIGNQLA